MRAISRPLGRRSGRSMRPTRSGWPAISSIAAAIALMRFGFKLSRSIIGSSIRPRAEDTSSAFAARIASCEPRTASAIANSAARRVSVEERARTRPAARARRAISTMSVGSVSGRRRVTSKEDEVVAVDGLVERSIPQGRLDVGGTQALDLAQVVGVVGGEASGELRAFGRHHAHGLAEAEVALDPND